MNASLYATLNLTEAGNGLQSVVEKNLSSEEEREIIIRGAHEGGTDKKGIGCYIEIIGIEFVTIWVRWQTHPTEIKATRVEFPSGDLGLIHWVSYDFVSRSK